MKRVQKNYDGSRPTGQLLKNLIPKIMDQLDQKLREDHKGILDAWSKIAGSKISQMAKAVSFENHRLIVKVESSTLLELLDLYEKKRLLGGMRKQFPRVAFKDIIFRIG